LLLLVDITRFICKYCKVVITKIFHDKFSGLFGTTIDELFLYPMGCRFIVFWSIFQNNLVNILKNFLASQLRSSRKFPLFRDLSLSSCPRHANPCLKRNLKHLSEYLKRALYISFCLVLCFWNLLTIDVLDFLNKSYFCWARQWDLQATCFSNLLILFQSLKLPSTKLFPPLEHFFILE
jgi:hypothetical protein